jgi:hypothetical protein
MMERILHRQDSFFAVINDEGIEQLRLMIERMEEGRYVWQTEKVDFCGNECNGQGHCGYGLGTKDGC